MPQGPLADFRITGFKRWKYLVEDSKRRRVCRCRFAVISLTEYAKAERFRG
jgi:hypothetical protein